MLPMIYRDRGRDLSQAPFDPFQLMNEMFRATSLSPWSGNATASNRRDMMLPDFDVTEAKNAYHIIADLPGVKEENVDISITGNCLTIRGSRESHDETGGGEDEGKRHHTVERRFGAFTRSFTLPNEVKLDAIDADMDGGVLTVSIPKSEKSQPKKISLKQRIKKMAGKDQGGE